MPKHFTRTGTWRDPRWWVSALERTNDKFEVKPGSKEHQQAKVAIALLIGAAVAFGLVALRQNYFG